MTRREKWTVGLVIVLIGVLGWMEATAPEPVDWSPSWSRYHDKPYGASLVHERLTDLFPAVHTTHRSIYENVDALNDTAAPPMAHVLLGAQFSPDQVAWSALLERVSAGDQLFVAAAWLGDEVADTLGLDMDVELGAEEVDLRFMGRSPIVQGTFTYDRHFDDRYFTRYDTSRTRVLAVDGASRPVLLQLRWGEGRIVVCSVPLAFTNHHLLKGGNARFMAGALSLLSPLPVLWDEHYKLGRQGDSSPMRYILSQPPLRWAWYLTLVLVVVFLVVRARREQRAIPIVLPPRNASRDQVHTVARLYQEKGDHADLARKMTAYFEEELRERTRPGQVGHDDATARHLAIHTGLEQDELEQRLKTISALSNKERPTPDDLLRLDGLLYDIRERL
ncbi:MAG: hypothetical protein KDB96_08890 [Flavobacteriales bacterium]|nr:hypothetical protein [Flavobacteriales bacterium]